MGKLGLDRQILAGITKNHQAIVALERVFDDVGTNLPQAIEAAAMAAAQAIAAANSAFAELVELSHGIEQLLAAPAPVASTERDDMVPAAALATEPDDMRPAVQQGTMASQFADSVEITGGAIDGTTVGATSTSSGAFTTLGATGLMSAAKGAALGLTIGDVTTNNGAALRLQGTSAGYNWHVGNNLIAAALTFTPSTATGGVTYTTPTVTITPGVVAVTGALTSSGGFGCNGAAAQTPAVSGGTLAGVIAGLVANGTFSS